MPKHELIPIESKVVHGDFNFFVGDNKVIVDDFAKERLLWNFRHSGAKMWEE